MSGVFPDVSPIHLSRKRFAIRITGEFMGGLYKRLRKRWKDLRHRLKMKGKHVRAYFYRTRLKRTTFIGITGSAGKTTATDLAAAVLSLCGPCQKTHAYSGPDAVAKMLLKTDKSHRFHVSELGVSGPGTLDLAIRLLKPHIAVITVIGRDHYSAFKSMEAIAAEKEKVVLELPPGGTAVLNRDDSLVRAIGERCSRRVVWFGEGEDADLRLLDVRSPWPEPLIPQIAAGDRTYEVPTQLHGVYMATPVLAALGARGGHGGGCAAGGGRQGDRNGSTAGRPHAGGGGKGRSRFHPG